LRVALLRFLLPLTLLVAVPLWGGGGRARAGYVTPVYLVSCPQGGFFTDGIAPADPDNMEALGESGASSEPQANDIWFLTPTEMPSKSLICGLSPAGAGSQAPPPSGPDAGGPNQLPCPVCRPPADTPALVGVLFLQTTLGQPPPFPSRLFRPPRLS
jgi:hypothetical protein